MFGKMIQTGLILSFLLLRRVSCFTEGLSLQPYCITMEINHPFNSDGGSSRPFTITPSSATLKKDNVVEVVLSSTVDFRGFMIDGRKDPGVPVGSFVSLGQPSQVRLLNCNGSPNTTMVHLHNQRKRTISGHWKAPEDGTFIFEAAVVGDSLKWNRPLPPTTSQPSTTEQTTHTTDTTITSSTATTNIPTMSNPTTQSTGSATPSTSTIKSTTNMPTTSNPTTQPSTTGQTTHSTTDTTITFITATTNIPTMSNPTTQSTGSSTPSTNDSVGTCPNKAYPHWTKVGPYCAKYFEYELAFGDAEVKCRGEAEDGRLISIHDEETSSGVQIVIGSRIKPVWIGGLRVPHNSEGEYIWTDGSKWNYRNWVRGQPDGSGPCVQMNSETPGKWDDTECWNTRAYICAFKI